MGKSIVHCSRCGEAIREEDLASRKAVILEHRPYCSDCRPAERPTSRKSSTSRIPITPKTARMTVRRQKPLLPMVMATVAALGLILILGITFLRKDRAEEATAETASKRAVPRSGVPSPAIQPPTPENTATLKEKTPPDPLPKPVKPEKEDPVPAVPEKPKVPEVGTLRPTIKSPSDGALFDAPAAVAISVDVPGDPDRVEFYEGSTKLGESAQRPHAFVWKDVPAGTYTLTAKAMEKGEVLISPPVSILVKALAEPAPEVKKPPTPPVNFGVDPRRVDEAIAKGAAYLKASGVKESMNPAAAPGLGECPELILWTLVHAGVPENDPDFVKLFYYVLGRKLERTYSVALQAMILEELNRVKYQVRIAQCAQFLMDAQCANGQWSYTGPAQIGTPTMGLKPEVATGGGSNPPAGTGARVKPKVVRKITSIHKMQEGPPTGDNSNSQYAALGLRACHDAGIQIPKAVIVRAQSWWRISQHDEEGKDAEKRPAVASGGGVPALPAGWCYGPKDHGHAAYSSMTAGAVGSVAIWDYLLDEKTWKKDPTLQKGIAWIDRHFTVAANDGPSEHVPDPGWMLYYYLYALERAGVLAGTETFGAHKWYVEGAEAILKAQKPDGSWLSPLPHGDRSLATNGAWDTCFAILFLKRATRPLEEVASTDDRGRK